MSLFNSIQELKDFILFCRRNGVTDFTVGDTHVVVFPDYAIESGEVIPRSESQHEAKERENFLANSEQATQELITNGQI
jgi:hypothetical protein